MRFTAGDVRGIIANRELTVARLRSAYRSGPESGPHSPQRAWMEASLRRYYAGLRNPDTLIGDYQKRTASKGTSVSKRSEIRNGEAMLRAFLALDEPEPTPRIAMHPRSDQVVLGHVISMGHDLVYEQPNGYLIREVWTDGVVRDSAERSLLRAASLLHAEKVFGDGRVAALETWQLRLGLTDRTDRNDALRLAPVLKTLLDDVARAVQT